MILLKDFGNHGHANLASPNLWGYAPHSLRALLQSNGRLRRPFDLVQRELATYNELGNLYSRRNTTKPKAGGLSKALVCPGQYSVVARYTRHAIGTHTTFFFYSQ